MNFVWSLSDWQSALMLAAVRFRHIAGTKWGECHDLDMRRLKSRSLGRKA